MSIYLCKKDMLPEIEKIKGVPPGTILKWELKERGLGTSVFAREIGEYPGIITDVTKLRRGITPGLSIKLGRFLGIEDDYFLLLQACYSIAREKKKELRHQPRPDLSIIRKWLFWDIRFEDLDFSKRKRFVAERVFERGNDSQIREIIRFYGLEECRNILQSARNTLYSTRYNALKYLDLKLDE